MKAQETFYREPIETADHSFGADADFVPDSIAIVDSLGVVRYFSPARGQTLPVSPEEIIGKHIRKFIHPDDLGRIFKWLGDCHERGNDTPLTYRSRHSSDRQWHWYEARLADAGSCSLPDQFIFMVRDITRHRRLEQQFLKSERITGCGSWRMKLDNPYIEVSPGLMRLLGYEPHEWPGHRKYVLLHMVHSSDVKPVLKTLREVIESPRLFSFCCRVRTRDGTFKFIRTRGHVETDVHNDPVAINCVSQDITRINREREKLRASEQKYRLLTERASDVICQLSLEGMIDFISPSVFRLTGRRPNRLIGQNFKTLLPESEHDAFDRCLEKLSHGEEHALCTLQFTGADNREGVCWFEISGRPLKDNEGKVYSLVCAARDISIRKKFEIELQEARKKAEEASAMKSKFLSNVSHELRTPLNAVLGFSELIGDQSFGAIGDSRYIEYARLIHESGSMLKTLINDLLDLSKIEAGKYELHPEHIDIKEVVPVCVRQIMPQAMKKGIAVNDRVSDKDYDLVADKVALTQILNNLLSNAVKFTPEGGRIEITARADASRIQLSVEDTGIGIRPEDMERVVAPFEQVAPQTGPDRTGTGLGLPLAKSLVELHGGELVLESFPGDGTKVTVILPTGAMNRAVA